MRVRDPEDKQRRLLDAALVEFAASGLAGSRIDAIARRAGVSAGLVYTYFGSKEALFDAVLDDITAQVTGQVPLDPANLPDYATALHDDHAAHPDIARYVAWRHLERNAAGPSVEAVAEATRNKIDLVTQAQKAGLISDRLPAAELVLAVQAVARMWFTQPVAVTAAVDPAGDEEARRRAIRHAVEALVRR